MVWRAGMGGVADDEDTAGMKGCQGLGREVEQAPLITSVPVSN